VIIYGCGVLTGVGSMLLIFGLLYLARDSNEDPLPEATSNLHDQVLEELP
jgi:hypothetical protein